MPGVTDTKFELRMISPFSGKLVLVLAFHTASQWGKAWCNYARPLSTQFRTSSYPVVTVAKKNVRYYPVKSKSFQIYSRPGRNTTRHLDNSLEQSSFIRKAAEQ